MSEMTEKQTTPRKRNLLPQRPQHEQEIYQAGTKKQKIFAIPYPPSSNHTPEWKANVSPLMQIPVEVLDKIFSLQSGLLLQDHLAFAGTCRAIRMAYTDRVWKALELTSFYHSADDICVAARHIFSAALADSSVLDVTQMQPSLLQMKIAQGVNDTTMTTTNARAEFKLTEKEVLSLPFQTKRNPHSRNAPPMKLFRRAQVYALAMRVHNGPIGHQAHLRKLTDRDAKAKATRQVNGTASMKTRHSAQATSASQYRFNYGLSVAPIITAFHDVEDEGANKLV